MLFSRRVFLQSALATPLAGARVNRGIDLPDVRRQPHAITASLETGPVVLTREGEQWTAREVRVRVTAAGLWVNAPGVALLRLRLNWKGTPTPGLRYLGDAWERSYGDLGWRGLEPERVMPWYVLASDGAATIGIGVKTGANALCYWQIDSDGVSLILEMGNGGRGVLLGNRELHAATLVFERYDAGSVFGAARRFCRALCDAPRMPSAPVYGGNNWYYAYGKSSADDIRRDSERVARWSPAGGNRPFMVIDDGWQRIATAGPWDGGNEQFPDMRALAGDMQRTGVRPGIWTRPLFTREEVPQTWRLRSPGAQREQKDNQGVTLDPTIPEVIAKIESDIGRLRAWGYQLIKHDYSTYDLVGRWGYAMSAELTDEGWSFADRSRTNAEIISGLYQAIRKAAADALVLGCNTIGHLSAGWFELQRTGDDTSGLDWGRTRKMGVNTLAFRAPQHGAFFAIDADCVGLTRAVPWQENRQWLDLLARSGTPLFVSAAPDAVGGEQERALREAFARAAIAQPLGEATDWTETTEPENWRFGSSTARYDWFAA